MKSGNAVPWGSHIGSMADKPRVVDGAAPGLVGPGCDGVAHRGHLVVVVRVGGLTRIALDGVGEVRPERSRQVQRRGEEAWLRAGSPRSGASNWSSTYESTTKRVPIRRTDWTLAVDPHRACRGQRGSDRLDRRVLGQGSRIGHGPRLCRLDGGRQLERRVVVREPDQEGRRLVDVPPQAFQLLVPDEGPGGERGRAEGRSRRRGCRSFWSAPGSANAVWPSTDIATKYRVRALLRV